jgi:hypothetical protein
MPSRCVVFRYHNKYNYNTIRQSTFSVTEIEGNLGRTLLDAGQNSSLANFVSETTFYLLWRAPNFHGTLVFLS